MTSPPRPALPDFLDEREKRAARADTGIAVAVDAHAAAATERQRQAAVALVLALDGAALAKLLDERGKQTGDARARKAARALTNGARGRGRPPHPADEAAIARARAAIAAGTSRDAALRDASAEVARETGARFDTVRRRLSGKLHG